MHNQYAKEVRMPKYRQRLERKRKGRGSYQRKAKHPQF